MKCEHERLNLSIVTRNEQTTLNVTKDLFS